MADNRKEKKTGGSNLLKLIGLFAILLLAALINFWDTDGSWWVFLPIGLLLILAVIAFFRKRPARRRKEDAKRREELFKRAFGEEPEGYDDSETPTEE